MLMPHRAPSRPRNNAGMSESTERFTVRDGRSCDAACGPSRTAQGHPNTLEGHMIRLNVPSLPFLAALPGLLFPGQAVRNGQLRQAPELVFSSEFAGVDKGGNCVWEGRAGGAVEGRLTIALRQVESPLEAANP